jgi:oxygen-dependent protoporphyrinogen oxidase
MRVVVIGGGITGLAAAWELQRHPSQPEVTLLEASDRLGGKIRTTPFAGLPAVDEGADAFLARVPWATELCAELGVDDLVSPASSRAYVWWNHRMHRIPDGLVLGVPKGLGGLARSGLMTWRGKARAALEPIVPRRPMTDALGATIRYRFGAEVLERLVGPLVGGINAGDADRLSLAATTPQLAEAACRSRSLLLALRRTPPAPPGPVFLAPSGGMQILVDALVARLDGAVVRLGHPAAAIAADGARWRVDDQPADAVIVTAPAWAAAGLLAAISPDAGRLLAGMDHASVALVTLAFDERHVARSLDGSGHLVPKAAQRHITACSWASTKWTGWKRDGQVLLRASLGRDGDVHSLEGDDGDVVNLAVSDLAEQLGITGDPLHQRVSRWERSFPQYRPGHNEHIAAIAAALRRDAGGVVATGAAYGGLGVPACIRQGREAARAVLARAAAR